MRKVCTAMCQNYAENFISLIQYGGTHWGGGLAVMKEYEIITLKYNGKACKLYLLCFCAPEDIILLAIRPGSTTFEGKHV